MPRNNIRIERTRLGISQGTLAKAMPDGVEAVALGFIENGRVLPTKAGMNALCELFGCRPDDLYDPSELNLATTGGSAPTMQKLAEVQRLAAELQAAIGELLELSTKQG